tara:strand:+ start:1021 stop:1227 length:207 start_codon:yes stop_codon:yes gene_type:complete
MKKIDFSNTSNDSSSVEITLQVRDKNGNPTGKTKSYSGESCRDASDWYNKQKPNKKKKRRKKKKEDNK